MKNGSSANPSPAPADKQTGVAVYIDGQPITLTREQEALIRAWASGPV